MRFLTVSLFATLLSAPAFAADLGTYRPGTPYNSAVAAGADVCDSQCSGDAQCRGWNYVKPNPQAAGICEFLSSVSAPISSQISISGENATASSFSSRVTTGATNTVRVGTQPSTPTNTVKVGQTQPTRRVVRQKAAQRIAPQQASTRSVEHMSLTEQQNRYRHGHAAQSKAATQAPVRQASRQAVPQQRPMFRPILDGPAAQRAAQPVQQQYAPQPQMRAPQTQQPQNQQMHREASRRATGPRRAPVQTQQRVAPQYRAPVAQQAQPQSYQGQQFQGQQYQAPQYQGQRPAAQPNMQPRGQSRPPVGQPIAASTAQARPQPSTPSQRLAQLTAEARANPVLTATTGPVALSPQQAKTSLFGRLNDDVAPAGMPVASAVPTQPVAQQELGEILAGGR